MSKKTITSIVLLLTFFSIAVSSVVIVTKTTIGSGDPGQMGNFRIHDKTAGATRLSITPSGNVGIGTVSPQQTLHVVGTTLLSGPGDLIANGGIKLGTLGSGGNTSLCLNSSGQISDCSSSLRYKDHLAMFSRGLDLITKLRPVTFTWKQDGKRDLGLGAEDVEQIEPLLVNYNSSGEVEGVKYDRINLVLINAIKQQQEQINLLQQQNAAIAARLKAVERKSKGRRARR